MGKPNRLLSSTVHYLSWFSVSMKAVPRLKTVRTYRYNLNISVLIMSSSVDVKQESRDGFLQLSRV